MKVVLRSLFILSICLIQVSVFAQSKKPSWVEQRPVNHFYYIGIGSAPKEGSEADYRQAAKDNALQDLSSEIQVNISSDFIHNLTEKSGIVEEDVKSQVRSSTKAFLVGYEAAGAWEDENTYWVYYRLSKELYEKKRNERRESALKLALDLYKKARQKIKNLDPASALRMHVQAVGAMQEFLAEPLKAKINGQTIILQNEIFNALQEVLTALELNGKTTRISAKSSQALEEPLQVTALFRDKSGMAHKVSGLPLNFSFARGKGTLVNYLETNAQGVARCQVSRIGSGDKLQIIQAQVAIKQMQPEGFSQLAQNIINNLSLPQVRFILNVSGLTVYVEASEKNLGRDTGMLVVEPRLKTAMADKGFIFTDDISKADILIDLKAASRKGAQVYNLYSAFADVTISVTDLRSGSEVYKKAFSNIKGIQLNFQKAGNKALQAAGEKMEQLLPEIIKPLQ